MRPSALLEICRVGFLAAATTVFPSCASSTATEPEPTTPTAQPELAYTPTSGGVATEARYRRDRNAMPKDKVATKKIDEAVNGLYLAGKMAQAEAQLKGIYEACGNDCSPSVKAKAWMYIGIVWGSGNGELKKAREAFRFALELDREARLDIALATPETQKVFETEKSKARATPAPAATGPGPVTAPPPGGIPASAPAQPAPAPAPASTRPGEPGVPIAPPPPPATR